MMARDPKYRNLSPDTILEVADALIAPLKQGFIRLIAQDLAPAAKSSLKASDRLHFSTNPRRRMFWPK
jgi:hypothetical protein